MDLDEINSGVGANVVIEQIGLNSNTQAGANYRYSFRTGDYSSISLGTSLNYINAQVNGEFLFPDGTTINERSQAHGFSAHAGLLFEVKGFIAGLSVFNLNRPTVNYKNAQLVNSYTFTRSLSVQLAYEFNVKENHKITPRLYLTANSFNLYALLSAEIMHFDKFYWAPGIRYVPSQLGNSNGLASSLTLGGILFNRLQIGFSLEYYQSNIFSTSQLALEGLIKYRINKKRLP